MRLVFDIESNGLPPWVGDKGREDLRVLCGVTQDVDTGEVLTFAPDPEHGHASIDDMVELLSRADLLIGHNISQFDVPVLEWLYGMDYRGDLYDTLRASQQIYFTNIMARTAKYRNAAGRSEKAREARFPKKYLNPRGIHSLKAWGYRLGLHKGTIIEDGGVQEDFSPELLDYCRRDVEINTALYRHLTSKSAERGWPVTSHRSMVVESRFAYLLGLQERNGVGFNRRAAEELYGTLAAEREELHHRLRAEVPPWWAPDGPKRGLTYSRRKQRPGVRKDGVRTGGVGAAPFKPCGGCGPCEAGKKCEKPKYLPPAEPGSEARTKLKLVEFNPGSRQHIARALTKLYGWKPKEFTDDGAPKVDENVLSGLDYPLVPDLIRYLMLTKRLGQLAEGKNAWLKLEQKGVIYGKVKPTGTRTSRCSHHAPNIAQVPAVGKPFGAECRALFRPTRPGWVQVGIDASGLELRMLGHRLAKYDGGEFGKIVTEGSSEDGTDIHSQWMKHTGILIRDNQKRWTYGTLYGAGDFKRGTVILEDWRQAHERGLTSRKPPPAKFAEELGKKSRQGLLQGIPALDLFMEACRRAFKRGWIRALDGRVVKCETEHGAVNDVLQSDGAVVMKWAKCIADDCLRDRGYVLGMDYAWMLDVHDEWQLETPPDRAEEIGRLGVWAIEEAGRKLGVRVPLTGEYKIGQTWAETH